MPIIYHVPVDETSLASKKKSNLVQVLSPKFLGLFRSLDHPFDCLLHPQKKKTSLVFKKIMGSCSSSLNAHDQGLLDDLVQKWGAVAGPEPKLPPPLDKDNVTFATTDLCGQLPILTKRGELIRF